MSEKLIKKLRADRDQYLATANGLLERMASDQEWTEADQANLDEATRAAQQLDARIAALTDQETARLRADARDAELNGLWAAAEHVTPPSGIAAVDFAAAAATAIVGLRATSGTVTVNLAAIDNRDADGKPLAGVTRVRDAGEPLTVTPLLDVIAAERVTSDTYEWEEWGLIPVAGDVSAAEGSLKPEATDGYKIMEGTLSTIAHHLGVSRRALQDKPGLEDKLRNRLSRGVKLKAEARAVAALLGGTYNSATHPDGLLHAIRYGIAHVSDAGYQPDTLIINPLDYADIDLLLLERTLNGAQRNTSAWNLRNVIPKAGVPAGTAFVGDAFTALLLTYRAEVALYLTDSHADEFTRNRIRILAEQRASVDLQQPNALVKCSVAASAPTRTTRTKAADSAA